ncbi:MFS general substrate transporter [Bimuria novae-zelandiae CBS 107.79]|uniref:MFS general substrate transporter n=1 Tax=Bimuria novae-zelandiae CBS 107.79 TaxID=1447943 RepID=A0A6A5VRF4_9PLEO|nr:MFS general substrate transporter [Bimuria novae-zelandiae CBS 107.79]
MEVTATNGTGELRQGIPSPPTQLEGLSSLSAGNSAPSLKDIRHQANHISLIKSIKKWRVQITEEEKRESDNIANGSVTKASSLIPIALRRGKRERLKTFNFTSTLNLMGNDTVTFDEKHWSILSNFMDAWGRNNSLWFHGLPTRNLSTTLVAISSKNATGLANNEPYICIRGLLDENDIVSFHAVLSRDNIRHYYSPLRICFDRSRIREAADERLYFGPHPHMWSLCGSIAATEFSGDIHYLTMGGLLDIDGSIYLLTANHNFSPAGLDTNQPASNGSTFERYHSQNKALIVDRWTVDSTFEKTTIHTARGQPVTLPEAYGDDTQAIALHLVALKGSIGDCILSRLTCQVTICLTVVPSRWLTVNIQRPKQIRFSPWACIIGVAFGLFAPMMAAMSFVLITRVCSLMRTAFHRGDSGAWVINKQDDSLLGHIITVSEYVAYVVPICQILREIEEAMPNAHIRLPSPFHQLAALAKRLYTTVATDEAKKEAQIIARKATSKDTMRAAPDFTYAQLLEETLHTEHDQEILARIICLVGADWEAFLSPQYWNSTMHDVDVQSLIDLYTRLTKAYSMLNTASSSGPRAIIKSYGIDGVPEKVLAGEQNLKERDQQQTTISSQGSNLIGWDSEHDPKNPRNWISSIKNRYVLFMSIQSFISGFGFTVLSGPAFHLIGEIPMGSDYLITLATSVYNLGHIFEAIFIAPLNQIYGHRAILLVLHTGAFTIATVLCTVKENAALLVSFRFLAGCTTFLPYSIGRKIMSNLFELPRASIFTGVLSLFFVLGISIGAISGSLIVEALSLNWAFYLPAAATVVVGIPAFVFGHDAYAPVLLECKAKRLRKETGQANLISGQQDQIRTFASLLNETWSLHIICSKLPRSCTLSIYSALISASVQLHYTTFPFVFEQQHHLSPSRIGSAAIGFAVGNVLLNFIGALYIKAFQTMYATKIRMLATLGNTLLLCGHFLRARCCKYICHMHIASQ